MLTRMANYERNVLSRIAFGNAPEVTGAAWWAACEALSVGGYIKAGKLTEKGRAALNCVEGH